MHGPLPFTITRATDKHVQAGKENLELKYVLFLHST